MTTRIAVTASQNLMTRSWELSNAYWNVQLLVNGGLTAEPFGGNEATILSDSTGTGVHQFFGSTSVAATFNGKLQCQSMYIKRIAGPGWFCLCVENGAYVPYFDIVNGVVGFTPNGVFCDIMPVPGYAGWFCIWTVYTAVTGTSERLLIPQSGNLSAQSYTGDGSRIIAVAGQQRVTANRPGPPQRTDGSAYNVGTIRSAS